MFNCLRVSIVVVIPLYIAVSYSPATAAVLAKQSETTLTSYDLGDKLVPNWTGGGLLSVEADSTAEPQLHVFDTDGRLQSSVSLRVAGASLITVLGFAHGVGGKIAVCGDAFDSEGRGVPYLAIFSAGGTSLRVIRTSPYHPRRVIITPDGDTWTLGTETEVRKPGGPRPKSHLRPDAGLIRRFNSEGKEIGSFISQSTIQNPTDVVQLENYLSANATSVAWYCMAEHRFVEIALDGKVLNDIRANTSGATETTGFAITDDGNVFISSVTEQNPKRWSFERLDRESHEWATVGGGPGWGILYGSNGNMLVAKTSGASARNALEFFAAGN